MTPFLRSLFVIHLSSLIVSSTWATGNVDPTNKYAWAENTGWANAAPTNGGVSVHFDGTSGYLTGFAWGENMGWIKLGDNTGGPYNNNSATDWGVNLNAASNLTGYAWGENVGWIKFDPAYSVVTIDMATGRFQGDAWGENIGWVRFKGTAPDYNVRTLAFDRQPQGTPNWWLANYGVAESYDAGDGVQAWKKYVMDTDPNVGGLYLRITAVSNVAAGNMVAFLPASTRRYYTLTRRESLTDGAWSNVVGQVGVAGGGGQQNMQDTNAALRAFYSVKVTLTP